MSKDHPGFKAVSSEISHKEGVPLKEAYAMLASSTRKVSLKAKYSNKNLKKVPGA